MSVRGGRLRPMRDAPILYSFRRCPYAMRARMALLAAEIPCIVREVVLRDKPPSLIAASAKATVPVLVLPDGQVIDQSLDIMRWAIGHNDLGHWRDGDDPALIAMNDGPFKHHLDRYKYPHRHGSDAITHRTAAMALLEELENRLQAADHLCGQRRSLCDVALFPFIRQFAECDRAWFDEQRLPRLQAWLAANLASPLFARAMIRRTQWRVGDPDVMLDSPPATA
jgi:glutathione S-transferase